MCSVLAVGSAALHALSMGSSAGLVAMLMIGACVSCAWDLWRHGSTRAWLTVALMNLAMIGAHLPVSAGHRHGGGATTPVPQLMAGAIALAMVETGAATVALYVRSRASYPDQGVDPAAGEVEQEPGRDDPQQRADLTALARGGAHHGP